MPPFTNPRRIVVLDPTARQLAALRDALRFGGSTRVELAVHLQNLEELLAEHADIDLIVVDLDLGDGQRSGVEVVRAVREKDADRALVAVAEHGDVARAESAIDAGATDFLVRGDALPQRVTTLFKKMGNVLGILERNRVLEQRVRSQGLADHARYRLVGTSEPIRLLAERIGRVAPVPRPVLIVGERGTGKELVAWALHHAAADDPMRPFVCVNCAAFTETLLESELFGHTKGAFTGAANDRPGKFQQADGGTLFLDEIGHMSISFQKKILRVVEYGTFTPVGGTKELRARTRIVAATNADLKEKMRKEEFLPDLYDRLAFEVLTVPPLRERPEDIEPLAQHFLEQFMAEVPAFQGKRLAADAVEVLRRHTFPGNVRELKNIIERAVYRDTTNELNPEDIGMLSEHPLEVPGGTFKDKVEAFEKNLVADALAAARGNQKRAAKLLGLSYHQFRYYNKKHSGEDGGAADDE